MAASRNGIVLTRAIVTRSPAQDFPMTKSTADNGRTVSNDRHPTTGQPIGALVDTTPAKRPGPVTLQGRYGRLEKLETHHATSLWTVFAGHEELWTYISTAGPFPTL